MCNLFLFLILFSVPCWPQVVHNWDSETLPPYGIERVVRRVVLNAEDHFILLDEETYDMAPALQLILDNATYWARRNMNETHHWLGEGELDQIISILKEAYLEKYGMNASSYSELYNTTISDPVVEYEEFHFTIARYTGVPMIITHLQLGENDLYLNWTGSYLADIPDLQDALEYALAWANYSVDKILYRFEPEVYGNIHRAFDLTSSRQLGGLWIDVVGFENSTLLYPIVVYKGHFFSFCSVFPGNTPPPLPVIIIVFVAVFVGFGLLGITVVIKRKKSKNAS
jgi:hypothetical protein